MRNYTAVGSNYDRESIDKAISSVHLKPFRNDVPLGQGMCIKNVIKECKIPLHLITHFDLRGCIRDGVEQHGFYTLSVNYKDGKALIYIADAGSEACIVASDFESKQEN